MLCAAWNLDLVTVFGVMYFVTKNIQDIHSKSLFLAVGSLLLKVMMHVCLQPSLPASAFRMRQK